MRLSASAACAILHQNWYSRKFLIQLVPQSHQRAPRAKAEPGDSNILVHLFDGDSPDKRRRARVLFEDHAAAGNIALSRGNQPPVRLKARKVWAENIWLRPTTRLGVSFPD